DEFGLEHGAGTFGDPVSGLVPTPDLAAPELASMGVAGSLAPSREDDRPSMRGEYTPVAATPVGTSAQALAERVTAAAASTAPASLTQAATPTQETPGQQTRIFYFFSPRCPYCAQQTPLLNAVVQGRHDVV